MSESTVDPAVYVDQAAQLSCLEIPPEYRAGVIDQWIQIQAIADLVMDFPLPESIEIAPVFEP